MIVKMQRRYRTTYYRNHSRADYTLLDPYPNPRWLCVATGLDVVVIGENLEIWRDDSADISESRPPLLYMLELRPRYQKCTSALGEQPCKLLFSEEGTIFLGLNLQ